MEQAPRDRAWLRDQGAFYTPGALAQAITSRALELHGPSDTAPTVLDPSCGAGAFLVAAQALLPTARLVGLDQDPAACAAAVRRVPGAEVHCCDALAPWAGPRPESVDLVLGNPPYVRCRRLPPDVRARLRGDYSTARGLFNLSVPFVQRSLQWLRPGGLLALVLPNKLLVASYARALRRLLCDAATLLELVDLSDDDPFAVAAYPVLLFARRGPPPPAHRLSLVAAHPDERRGWSARAQRSLPQTREALGQPARADPWAVAVEAAGHAPLGGIVRLREALHTGNMRARLLSDRRRDEADVRLLRGRDCGRYTLRWAGLWACSDLARIERSPGEYARIPPAEVFAGPKLLLREISRRPAACLDPDDHLTLNKVYPLQELGRLDEQQRLALLALLNSGPFFRLFQARYRATHLRGGYLQFKAQYVHAMPVPPLAALVGLGLAELAAGQGVEISAARDRLIDARVLAAYGVADPRAPAAPLA